PSIVVVWLLGLALAANLGLFEGGSGLGWLHAKLLIVLLLSGFHGWAVAYSKKLAKGQGGIPARRLRMLGELPALAVILIVILAVVKPF
ncbi:CopD family protein, partial [Escherichia coli]|uniref:CopD family protein n=4 Tax=Pseudomonadota TaxID=1224 RepID=UPI00193194DF|nr:CopD family protein [Escherichia coli]